MKEVQTCMNSQHVCDTAPCCRPKVLGDQLTAVQFCVASTDQGSSSSLLWPLAENGLIQVKERVGRGFPRAGRAAPKDFPRSSPASPKKTRPSRLFYLDLTSI